MQLWLEFADRTNVTQLFEPSALEVLKVFMHAVQQRLSAAISAFTARLPILEHRYVQFARTVIRELLEDLLLMPFPPSWKQMPLSKTEIKETFTKVCTDLKAAALAEHGVNVTFVISSVPDFFNETLGGLVVEACEKAGIGTAYPRKAFPRLFSSFNLHPNLPRRASVLAIHQGEFHAGVQLLQAQEYRKDKLLGPYIPLHHWMSRSYLRQLTTQIIELYPEVETQIFVSADEEYLTAEISTVRLQLKHRNSVVEFLGLDGTPSRVKG
ncbi:hypothetical protein BDW74DRAFT_49816 [Aspergillus multicolor]|uniref:uncharacterized protein n=1 Tax=Aspergillus multicolor TaxID=41759 RepID=UPI003CCD53A4